MLQSFAALSCWVVGWKCPKKHDLGYGHLDEGFPGGARGKNQPSKARELRNAGSIPAWERSPGGGDGNPLQYSCLENPVDRGTSWAMVHKVAKSWT